MSLCLHVSVDAVPSACNTSHLHTDHNRTLLHFLSILWTLTYDPFVVHKHDDWAFIHMCEVCHPQTFYDIGTLPVWHERKKILQNELLPSLQGSALSLSLWSDSDFPPPQNDVSVLLGLCIQPWFQLIFIPRVLCVIYKRHYSREVKMRSSQARLPWCESWPLTNYSLE